ncbi:Ethylene-responsive transcription factor, partial [Melia azedarach]
SKQKLKFNKMQGSSKRPRLANSAAQPQPLTPPRLTSEQELSVMVAALRNVVVGNTNNIPIDFSPEFFQLKEWITTASATATTPMSNSGSYNNDGNFGNSMLPPPSSLDTCQVCKIQGCLGCNFFPPNQQQEQKKTTATASTGKKTREEELQRGEAEAVGKMGSGDS